jgi:hypothetical protein
VGVVGRQRQERRDDHEERVGEDDRPLQRRDDPRVPSQPLAGGGKCRADRTFRPAVCDRRIRVGHGLRLGRDARRSSRTTDTQ